MYCGSAPTIRLTPHVHPRSESQQKQYVLPYSFLFLLASFVLHLHLHPFIQLIRCTEGRTPDILYIGPTNGDILRPIDMREWQHRVR